MPTVDEALEELAPLQRTKDYPKESRGMLALAKGLIRACEVTGKTMEAIVRRCADTSPYCPTDADLLTVAKDMVRIDAVIDGTYDATANHGNHASPNRVAEWRKECGPPVAFPLDYDHEKAKRCHREYDELWRVAKGMGLCEGGRWAQDKTILAALRKAGYPKTEHQTKVMKAWEKVA